MAIRTGRLGNVTFAKESTWGNFTSATNYLRVSTESLKRGVEHAEDPSLVSEIYTTDMIKISDGIGGSMEGVMHGDDVGYLLYGILGNESTDVSDPVMSYMAVSYNGVSDYARLTKSGANLTAELSSNGSTWTLDTNFASAGVIDVSAAAYDTLTELSTYIAGRTGWDAVLFGSSSESSGLSDFTATSVKSAAAKVGAKLMTVSKTSTLAKTHTLTPANAATSLPSFSFTINRVLGTNESISASGVKLSSISLSNAAKDLCKYSITVTGKQETESVTDASVSIPTIEGYLSANMKIVVINSSGAMVEMDEVKDYSLTINANLDDNKVVGSYYGKEPDRQNSTIEFSFTANNTSTQYAIRSSYTGDTPVETYLYWKSNDYADTANTVPYSILIRIPDSKLTDFNSPLSTPDRLTITGAGKVVKPQNSTYTEHIYCYIVDTKTTVY